VFKVQTCIEHYKFRDGLYEVIDLARKGNKYLHDNAPWTLAKTPELQVENQKRIDNCLHLCLQLTANLAILANPFLPFTAQKMCYMMKVVDRMLEWENAGKINLLNVGYPLRPPELLFRKIEDTEVAAQVEKLRTNLTQATIQKVETKPEEVKPEVLAEAKVPKAEITYDDFAKLDLRAGTIIAAEKVEKADKLLKLTLDMGTEQRTVVSGIAMHFKPEDIVGKQVTVVANLAPRKMRGIESQGMILMAENADGKLIFVAPSETADNGSEVK